MRTELSRAPREVTGVVIAGAEISLPMPDGTMQRFRIVESPVMAPQLAAKYPEIKTYVGQGIDDATATARLDMTPAGFHAQILSPQGAVYIDPHLRDRSIYASYYKRDYRRDARDFVCLTELNQTTTNRGRTENGLARSGGNLRTYRLACAADAEYTIYHGGTVASGLAAVVTAVNRVTGVYETELAIRLELVADNDLIIYTGTGSDPYSNNSGSTMLSQNQANLDSVIGSANYDIGHVFSTGGGGVAILGVVCVTGSKARGVTGNPAPVGDSFWIDYVAHEMGHQFGANHTFNSSTGNCGGGNRNPSTAYEVGSGSTIMAYAGICGGDDLQPHSDPYFHSISFDEIIALVDSGSGSSCAVVTSTGNTAPTVIAGANYTIPANTPFMLTANGSDPDNDALTYCWEERDLGPSTTLSAADNGASPLFRVFNPTTNAWRTFPKLSDILNNTTTLGEKLPTTSRTMNFRVTARDNRAGGGGVNTDDTAVTVVSSAGPFVITSHGSGGTFSNTTTVNWNVAGTASAPISAANVNILLSTNGGQSFPIVLAANTPNDGSQVITLPNINTTVARLRVEGAGNIFFDVNSSNFTIIPGVPAPAVILNGTQLFTEQCSPGNGAIDPGEQITLIVFLRNLGSAPTTNLVATLLATGGVSAPSSPQNYGALTPSGTTVARTFTFTANGSCGGNLVMTFQLQDGAADLGNVTASSVLGGFVTNQVSFTNATQIAVPASGTRGQANPYPSTINVAGLPGTITKATVTLVGVGHSYWDDMDAVLVSPGGQKIMLFSDAGGAAANTGLTLTFDDAAASGLADATTPGSGTFLPGNFDSTTDAFPSPIPGGTIGTSLAVLNGLSPNGTWSLYVQDDQQQDTGNITQGWRLNLWTLSGSCCTGNATNQAPTFLPISQKTVTELQPMTFTNAASDPDGNALIYSLGPGAPSNSTLNAISGVFAWTPTESQGPSTNAISIVVTDSGTPSLSTTQTFTAIVLETNAAPNLPAIASRVVHAGAVIQFTNSASDSDLPSNALTFSLQTGAPAAASVNATNGVFVWPTSDADAGETNSITVLVTDNGVPNLSAGQTFSTAVLPRPVIQSIEVSNAIVTLSWNSIAGQAYQLQSTTNLPPANWFEIAPAVIAVGPTASQSTTATEEARYFRVHVLP